MEVMDEYQEKLRNGTLPVIIVKPPFDGKPGRGSLPIGYLFFSRALIQKLLFQSQDRLLS